MTAALLTWHDEIVDYLHRVAIDLSNGITIIEPLELTHRQVRELDAEITRLQDRVYELEKEKKG